MKKFLLSTLAIVTLFAASCKKEKENIIPPVKERVAGEWKMAYYADDDNNNQKLDENEKYDADDDETNTIIFMGDGSGMTRSVYTDFNGQQYVDESPFKWSMNGEKEIVITISEENYTETTVAQIETLTTNEMVLMTVDDYMGETYRSWIGLSR